LFNTLNFHSVSVLSVLLYCILYKTKRQVLHKLGLYKFWVGFLDDTWLTLGYLVDTWLYSWHLVI